MRKTSISYIAAAILAITNLYLFIYNYVFDDYQGIAVPDEESACAIAEAVFLARYGTEASNDKPYRVYYHLESGAWSVYTYIPDAPSGYYKVAIRAHDGKILKFYFMA